MIQSNHPLLQIMQGTEKQKQEKAAQLLHQQMHELFHQLSAKQRQLEHAHAERAREKSEHAAELSCAPPRVQRRPRADARCEYAKRPSLIRHTHSPLTSGPSCRSARSECQHYMQRTQVLEAEKAAEVEHFLEELQDADYREEALKADTLQLAERLELQERECETKVRALQLHGHRAALLLANRRAHLLISVRGRPHSHHSFIADQYALVAYQSVRTRLQMARADELADEAMIKCNVAEKQRDDAEAQLAIAAQEKVAALLHLSELTSRLHDRGDERSASAWVCCRC